MSHYLARLRLAVTDPAVQDTLANPYRLHQAVFAGFDRAERNGSRVLYRLEPELTRQRQRVVLVQSALAPDWRRPGGERWGDAPQVEVRPLALDELRLDAGQTVRFRLLANPTVKRRQTDDGPTVRRGLYTLEEQEAWLARKLADAGAAPLDVLTTDEGIWQAGDRRWLAIRYDGHLRVRDPAALRAALAAGLGSAKGFGFGLLSLGPPRG